MSCHTNRGRFDVFESPIMQVEYEYESGRRHGYKPRKVPRATVSEFEKRRKERPNVHAKCRSLYIPSFRSIVLFPHHCLSFK